MRGVMIVPHPQTENRPHDEQQVVLAASRHKRQQTLPEEPVQHWEQPKKSLRLMDVPALFPVPQSSVKKTLHRRSVNSLRTSHRIIGKLNVP